MYFYKEIVMPETIEPTRIIYRKLSDGGWTTWTDSMSDEQHAFEQWLAEGNEPEEWTGE